MDFVDYDEYRAGQAVLDTFGFTEVSGPRAQLPTYHRVESPLVYYQLRGDGYYGFDLCRIEQLPDGRNDITELILCEPVATDALLCKELARHLTPLEPPA